MSMWLRTALNQISFLNRFDYLATYNNYEMTCSNVQIKKDDP